MNTESQSNNKRIAKNTAILYIRMIVLMAVSLYTSRVILSALGVDDFGIYNVVGGIVTCIAFLNGTLSTATTRYITVAIGKGDDNRSSKVFSSVLLINVILGVILIFVCETIGLWFFYEKMNIPIERQTAAMWVYQLSVATVLLSLVCVPYNASIIAYERMKAFAYITLVDAFAKLGIAFVISEMISFDKLIFYAIMLFLIQVMNQIIYTQYCIRNFNESHFNIYIDKPLLKEMWKFISWSAYGSLVSVGFTQGLNIILNIFFGPAVNAARGIAVQVQNSVNAFTINFQTAINPQLIKTYAKSEFDQAKKLLVASSRFSFYLLCLIGLPIIGNAQYILSIWLKEVPDHAVTFVQLMLLVCMFQSIANPLRIVNQAEGNIKKFQLYECTYLLFIVPASYIFLRLGFEAETVFVVQLFIEVTAQFIRLWIVLPKIKMSIYEYMKNVYYRILPIFFISSILIYFLPTDRQTFGELILNTVAIELLFISMVLTFGISSNERKLILNYIKIFKK